MKKVPQSSRTSSSVAPPQQVLVQHLDACWESYRAEQKRIRREFTDKYVHDLRVSIRRLISMIDIGRALVDGLRLKRTRRLLKSQLDAFDELRDTQVQITIVDKLQESMPEIVPYQNHLHKREKKLIARLQKKLAVFRAAGLAKPVARLRKALLAPESPEGAAAILSMVDKAYEVVMQRKAAVRADQPKTIHRLRLAFKKFRYMVKNIYPLLPDSPADFRRQLHDYQTLMGDVQDVAVGTNMLGDFAAKNRTEFPAAMAVFEDMQRVRIQAFIENIDSVNAYWRATPRKKFPWQLKQRNNAP